MEERRRGSFGGRSSEGMSRIEDKVVVIFELSRIRASVCHSRGEEERTNIVKIDTESSRMFSRQMFLDEFFRAK